ncbi:retrovirus-related Pol polyprotein from transposon TNT 1-94 [Senna tora]|uniref:Retrovirus-related Pol polyprotein from transposon TNT 1-94 n=1 Tax=Senna tora TaxID=362788 RepID=A0A834WCD4_9FABA|nr:retrovirus-related Pol polyprotein from transposon TNT 1-94 [Senna tora]
MTRPSENLPEAKWKKVSPYGGKLEKRSMVVFIAIVSESVSDNSSQRKTISPYDLTSIDNPGLSITQVQLIGENYDEWACAVKTALKARKKFGFVDGTIGRPNEKSSDFEDWWTINFLLVSWIRNSIEPSLRSTISRTDVAQVLWDELASLDPVPTCECGKCTCELSSIFEKKREEERVHTFLLGLDATLYSTVRSSILTQDPVPNVNKVYSILIQEERVKTIARTKDERVEVMALAARTRNDGRDKTVVCSHCKRNGHEAENCFALVGYPEWWGDRPRGDGKGTGRAHEHDTASLVTEEQPSALGRGHRHKEISVRLRDYVTHTILKKSPSMPSHLASQRSSGNPYPIANYL